MRNALILDLADCTEFRQRLQARPPRVVHGAALLLAALLGTALVWSGMTEADLVVRAPGRVRPADTPRQVFNPVRGEVLSGTSGGRVVEVNFREGDAVEKGEVLVRFDTGRLDNEIVRQKQTIKAGEVELAKMARLEELQARQFEATRAKTEAELEQAREELRRARERQATEVRAAETELASARDAEERLRRLAARQAASQSDLAQVVASRRSAEERLKKTRVPLEEGKVAVRQQALALAEKDFALRRAQLGMKRAARQAEVESARIELDNLELERRQAVLLAPIDGIVTAGEVRVGDLLGPGKLVLEIAPREGFIVEAVVPSEEVGPLRVGMRARVKLDAYDYQRYGTLEGTVSFISPDSGVHRARPASGDETPAGPPRASAPFYVVRITLDSDEVGRGPHRGRVKLGMAGQVEIVTEQENLLSLLLKKIRRTISLG